MAKGKRNFEENAENMKTASNEAPESKFQNDQQIADSTGFKVDAGKSDFKLDKRKASGSTLKQEVAASVVKDASYGGSLSGDGANFNGMRSSGSVGGILGAANATPVAGKSRSEGRTSKKLDRNSTKLNFIPSEQVLTEWDESKPLADSANDDQGFNGTYRNEFARSQKNKEAVPGALMFDRSVDLLVKDNLYFGQGQKISQSGVTTEGDLTCTMKPDTNGVYKYTSNGEYVGGTTGNYLLKDVNVLFDKNGVPAYTVYDDENLSVSTANETIANKSSAQDHILMNDAELVRETMDSKAGDEKADIWTPLARAVKQPTSLAGFLRDLEATVGNEVLTGYRKFSTSMSFQLNRAHKDGQDPIKPAILANRGLNYNFVSNGAVDTTIGTAINSALFSHSAYISGSASTMIPLYDSIAKYNNKADFLVQPRSYRMHLQTADNNIDPLHCGKLFNQVYANQEVFSTIDRDYDPMAPVCLSDKAGVISRLSHHLTGSFVYDDITYDISTSGQSASVDFTLIPKKMMSEIHDAGYSIYLVYPHELTGDIDNVAAGVITADSSYAFTNGKKIRVFIKKASDIEFSTSKAYPEGAFVVYNNYLYKCTKSGGRAAGSWDSDDFTKQTIDGGDANVLTISNASISTSNPLIYRGSGSAYWNITDCVITSGASKIYAYKGGPVVYGYDDLRNNYIIIVKNPLTEGLDKYFLDGIGGKYHKIIKDSGNNSVVKIPAVHSTMFFSLWSILLCAATPYIIKERINSFRDVLYYEKNVEYPFGSTLIPIRDCLTKSYTNFVYKDYDTELSSNVMSPATALTWILPEMYQQVGYASSESQVLMPWYTNQAEIKRASSGSYEYLDDASAMSFPSIRSGVKLASLDTLYGMSEKDVRLSIDKVSSFAALNPTLGSSHTYKYSSVGDGQLILSITPSTMIASNIMSLPRELGFFMTAPYGVLTPNYSHVRSTSESVLGATSFRCYYWFGANATETDDQGNSQILKSISINVNRAANFKQNWYCVLASGTTPAIDHGFFLSANQAYSSTGATIDGRSSFKPYATLADEVNGNYGTNMNVLLSMQKFLWTRIQKLPFVLSPFDGKVIDNSNNPNNTIIFDPYDLLYVFGLGGFRASDFRESVYNREKEIVNQGMLFVSDPWVESSPIFREGSLSTGIKMTKGFSL